MVAALGANPSLPAGSYRYTATLNGKTAGSTTLTVQDSGGNTKIDENATASTSGIDFTGNASLVLGADLVPTQYAGSYKMGGQQAKVDVSLTPTTATVTGAANPRPQTFALDANAKHFVVIEPGLLAGLFALPAQTQAWNNAAVTAIVPVFGREESLAFAANPSAPRPAGVPAADVALDVAGPYQLTVWYDPATLIPDEFVLASQNATVTRVRD